MRVVIRHPSRTFPDSSLVRIQSLVPLNLHRTLRASLIDIYSVLPLLAAYNCLCIPQTCPFPQCMTIRSKALSFPCPPHGGGTHPKYLKRALCFLNQVNLWLFHYFLFIVSFNKYLLNANNMPN